MSITGINSTSPTIGGSSAFTPTSSALTQDLSSLHQDKISLGRDKNDPTALAADQKTAMHDILKTFIDMTSDTAANGSNSSSDPTTSSGSGSSAPSSPEPPSASKSASGTQSTGEVVKELIAAIKILEGMLQNAQGQQGSGTQQSTGQSH